MTTEQRKVCLRAIDHFGIDHQKNKLMEELGELIVELSREQDRRSSRETVIGELADVMIMCEQMRMIYGASEVDAMVQQKIDRLWRMMRLPKAREVDGNV